MPNRIIHEKACSSRTLDQLSDFAERLFWRLTVKADDYGRFDFDPRWIMGQCFPLQIGRLAVEALEAGLAELIDADLIRSYEVDGRVYAYFTKWKRYQRERNSKPKYPDPPQLAADGGSRARVSRAVSSESRDDIRETGRLNVGRKLPQPAANGTAPEPTEAEVRALIRNTAAKLGIQKPEEPPF